MKLRRGAHAPWKILLVLGAVIAVAAAFSGSGASVIEGTPYTSSPCPPGGPTDGGRAYCLILSTFDHVQAAGVQKVTLRLKNYDNNTLTNPVIKLSWVDEDLTVTWTDPKPSICSGPATGPITCNLANVPGKGSQAGTEPPNFSEIVTLYFESTGVGASPDIDWSAEASVNEGPSGTPNISVRRVGPVSTDFDDPGTTNSALSFALPGKKVLLGTTGTGSASLQYVSSDEDPFDTSLIASTTPTFCFADMTCAQLELASSVPGEAGGLLVWHFIIQNSPIAASSVKIVHIYDPAIDVPANVTTDKFTGDFRGVDGVEIDGKSYYVRNPTADDFKVSEKKSGNAYYDVQSTSILLKKIGLIGDQKQTEVDSRCNGSLFDQPPGATPNLPSVNATKIGNTKDVDVWFCDGTNGNIGPWG